MSLSRQFRTDADLETKGIVLDYGDARIRAARAGGANKKFLKTFERRTKPHRRAIAADAFDRERSNQILMEVYADAVVLNWETRVGDKFLRGIDPNDAERLDEPVELAADGSNLLPYSKENVLKVFRNLPDLFTDVVQQTQNGSLFQEEVDEALAGN